MCVCVCTVFNGSQCVLQDTHICKYLIVPQFAAPGRLSLSLSLCNVNNIPCLEGADSFCKRDAGILPWSVKTSVTGLWQHCFPSPAQTQLSEVEGAPRSCQHSHTFPDAAQVFFHRSATWVKPSTSALITRACYTRNCLQSQFCRVCVTPPTGRWRVQNKENLPASRRAAIFATNVTDLPLLFKETRLVRL